MIKYLVASSILMFGSLGMIGQQQQAKTFVEKDGTKEVLDSTTGWTETEKNGKVTHVSVADMTSLCSEFDKSDRILLAVLRQNPGGLVMTSEICDMWAELQPKTQIERMPFSQLMTRLLSIAPPSSSFARYRGMELESGTDSTTYDAVILPSDIGYDASCKVEAENRHEEGMMYTYECSVKTPSFPAALQLRDRLVQTLSGLHLTEEDEVREHGLAANSRTLGYCAPNGECMEGHIYVSAMKDWKIVQIEPNPVFTRDTLSEIAATKAGRHAPINGIAANEANLSFRIVSVGPNKADGLGQGNGQR
jgi:hypothetical protein